MKKCVLRCLILIAFLLVPGAVRPEVLSAQGQPLASLDPVQGLIQYQTAYENPQDLQSWHTVTQRVLVSEGDRIRTDGSGLAYLTFFEGIQSQIGPSTMVVISTLSLPVDAYGNVNISMDVLVGNTLSTVEAVLDPSDRFEIHTPGATAVIRGTEWWTVVEPDGSATFATKSGKVLIIPRPLQIMGAPPPGPGDRTPEPAAEVPLLELTAGKSLSTTRLGIVSELAERFREPERPLAAALAGPNCGNNVCDRGERVTCLIDCPGSVRLVGCGDGICQPDLGEDLLLCPGDCGPWQGMMCADGICDSDESGITCPADCESEEYFSPFDPKLCGNATCDASESALTCPADCGAAITPDATEAAE